MLPRVMEKRPALAGWLLAALLLRLALSLHSYSGELVARGELRCRLRAGAPPCRQPLLPAARRDAHTTALWGLRGTAALDGDHSQPANGRMVGTHLHCACPLRGPSAHRPSVGACRYRNSSLNDLSYWGLDYPPLSAYQVREMQASGSTAPRWEKGSSFGSMAPVPSPQSWLCGKYVQLFEPEVVELGTSRGYESPSSKRLLRWTVMAADALVALPAALAAANTFGGSSSGSGRQRLSLLVAMLFSPALVLIDHGHFQYNCIGLGLAAGSAAAAVSGRHVLAAVVFSLSLNHKQMGLYYAPAFFAYLLGKCLQRPTPASKVRCMGWLYWSQLLVSVYLCTCFTSGCSCLHSSTAVIVFTGAQVGGVAALGVAVLATFGMVWAPWLRSPVQNAWLGVVYRVFPTQRGLYEDYVANWWCASSRLIKWVRLLTQPRLVQLCGGTTLVAAAPAMAAQVMRPTPRGFLLCLANSAMAFFLFSYQVRVQYHGSKRRGCWGTVWAMVGLISRQAQRQASQLGAQLACRPRGAPLLSSASPGSRKEHPAATASPEPAVGFRAPAAAVLGQSSRHLQHGAIAEERRAHLGGRGRHRILPCSHSAGQRRRAGRHGGEAAGKQYLAEGMAAAPFSAVVGRLRRHPGSVCRAAASLPPPLPIRCTHRHVELPALCRPLWLHVHAAAPGVPSRCRQQG